MTCSQRPTAPTLYPADTDLRLGVPAILQRVTQSTSDLHGHTTDTVGIVPIQVPMPDGQHSAIARGPRCFCAFRTEAAELILLPDPLLQAYVVQKVTLFKTSV